MIGILGLVLSVLGILALFDYNTPLGKKVKKRSIIKDKYFMKFFINYRKGLFYLSLSIIGVLLFFLLSVYDFFRTQSFIFSTLYLLVITFVFLLILINKKYKLFEKLIKIFVPYVYSFFLFSIFLGFLSIVMDRQITNKNLEKIYQTCKANPNSKRLIELRDGSALEYRNRYLKEIKLISTINMINQYKQKYSFNYDLSNKKDTTNKKYSKLINVSKKMYNTVDYSDFYKKTIQQQVTESNKIKIKPLHLFPVSIQPLYMSSYIVFQKTHYFSSLAVGSKIYIVNIYNKLLSIGIYGAILLIPFIGLLSFWLTIKINLYNKKYSKNYNTENNYFFVLISIFGFLLTIISMF